MIVVNARFLTQQLSGVQRFAEQISLALCNIRDDVTFVSPADIVRPETARILNVKQIGHRTGQKWEQMDLPLWLAKQGSPLLLSLCSTAPLLYKNQIATHHDINYIRYPQSYSKAFRTAYRVLTPLLLKRIRALVTVSDFSKKEISDFYGFSLDSIGVVPNAVSSEFQVKSSPRASKVPYLLAVSSPSYHKNFSRMIEAFLSLKKWPGIELHIVGNAHSIFGGNDLNELARRDPRIRLLGRIDDKELIQQYQGAAGFVFPSLYEGFGIPPLEAQACGCPVIAANTASMPEVLEDSVLYFDPFDTSSIADAMRKLLKSTTLQDHLRQRGLENVRRFSWDLSAQRVSSLLDIAQTSDRYKVMPSW